MEAVLNAIDKNVKAGTEHASLYFYFL